MKIVFFSILLLISQPVLAGEEKKAAILSEQDLDREIKKGFDRHDFRQVIEIYRNYANDHPEAVMPLTAQVFYSQSLASSGETEDAIEVLQKILTDFPPEMRFVRLQYDFANLLMMEKKMDAARQAFEKVIFEASRSKEFASKARERLSQMKDREGKKKDVTNLQLIEIESALDAGQPPDGAFEVLQKIEEQNPKNPIGEQARLLTTRLKEVRVQKATALLDEARRLFDVDRKFVDVRVLLEQIQREYPDFEEKQSVEALLQLVDQKLGKPR